MLKDVLLTHFDRYPLMTPQDAVKLIYQQEFGPEHLIRDPGKALAALRKEMVGLEADAAEPLYEPIGNGLCRLNLRPCMARGIPAEDICRMFCETAQSVSGDRKRFRQGLRELRALAEAEETPFDAVELDLFLAQYPDACPAVRHSEAYRAAYRPAYRLVLQKKIKDDLAARRKRKAENGNEDQR